MPPPGSPVVFSWLSTGVLWSQLLWPSLGLPFSSSHTPFSCIQLPNHSAASWEVILLFFQAVLCVKEPSSSTYSSQSVPGSFQHPYSGHSLPEGPCSSSEGDRWGLPRVLLLDALHSCFIGKLRASSCSTTVSGRYLCRALYIPCQDHVVSHSKSICRDTFTESHWVHFRQSKYPLAPNLTQSTESESTLPSVCREDYAREWAENEILIPPPVTTLLLCRMTFVPVPQEARRLSVWAAGVIYTFWKEFMLKGKSMTT